MKFITGPILFKIKRSVQKSRSSEVKKNLSPPSLSLLFKRFVPSICDRISLLSIKFPPFNNQDATFH